MQLNFFVCLISLFLTINIYGQEGSTTTAVSLGFSGNNIPSLSTGLAYGYVDYYYNFSVGAGGIVDVLIPLKRDQPWGIRAGVEAFATIIISGIGIRADIIRYSLNNTSEFHFSPGVGWSIGFLNFMYSYSTPLKESSKFDIKKHQFTAQVLIPLRFKRSGTD